MKRLITSLQKHSGTTRSEAITVLSIALVVAAGTVGPWIFGDRPQHEVATADRILALLDSAAAIPTQGLGTTRDASTRDTSSFAEIATSNSSRSRPSSRSVNINTASMAQLERLPGVGPATAEAIVKRRAMRPFRTVDDLMDIRGIGPKKLAKMRPYVTCTNSPTP